MKNEPSIVGQNIRALRRKAKLLQKELSEASGVPCATISRVEEGYTQVPTLSALESLAAALGVTVGRLWMAPDTPPTDGPEVAA